MAKEQSMNEEQVRKIVWEEIYNLLTHYESLRTTEVALTNKTKTCCYGAKPKYSNDEIIEMLRTGYGAMSK